MSSSNEVFKAFFEFKGSGRIVFDDDDISADVSFNIKMLQNGTTIGELDLNMFHPSIESYARQRRKFSIYGKLNDENMTINVQECYLTSISPRYEFSDSKMIESVSKAKFTSGSVLLFLESEYKIPDKDLFIRFGIINNK